MILYYNSCVNNEGVLGGKSAFYLLLDIVEEETTVADMPYIY